MKHLWKHPLIRRRAPTIRKRRETAQIFERYKNALFHTARRMTASDSDAEDAVMLAMERVCRHMERTEVDVAFDKFKRFVVDTCAFFKNNAAVEHSVTDRRYFLHV